MMHDNNSELDIDLVAKDVDTFSDWLYGQCVSATVFPFLGNPSARAWDIGHGNAEANKLSTPELVCLLLCAENTHALVQIRDEIRGRYFLELQAKEVRKMGVSQRISGLQAALRMAA